MEPAFRRYVRILFSNGIRTTVELVHRYYICDLVNIKGLGQKFYGLLTEFIENQKRYMKLWAEVHNEENGS